MKTHLATLSFTVKTHLVTYVRIMVKQSCVHIRRLHCFAVLKEHGQVDAGVLDRQLRRTTHMSTSADVSGQTPGECPAEGLSGQ